MLWNTGLQNVKLFSLYQKYSCTDNQLYSSTSKFGS